MKRLYFLLAIIISLSTAFGRERSMAEMRASALKKLSPASEVKGVSGFNKDFSISEVMCNEAVIVFAPSIGDGFAIVSRDDTYPDVIGYGTTHFDATDLPCCLNWWLQHTTSSMTKGSSYSTSPKNVAHRAVSPIISTKWGQGAPYNNLAPIMSGRHAPAGCVATAMAQILNFNQYPIEVDFSGRYRTGGEETVKTEFVKSTYSYPYRKAYGYYYPDGYTSDEDYIREDYTDDEAQQIATLLRDCGFAIEMNYADGGSGASLYVAADALLRKFGYSEQAIMFYMRSFYTDEEWHDIVLKELEHGFPVIYGGSDEEQGGHAFVVHGCDADGLVYVNWGWDGSCDGFYNMDLMDPTGYTFSKGQHLVTGLRPQPLASDLGHSLLVVSEPYTLRTARGRIAAYFASPAYNLAPVDLYGRIALIMEDIDTGEKTATDIIDPGTGPRTNYEVFDGLTQTNAIGERGHHYHVYIASLQDTEQEWQPIRTYGGAFYYDLFVTEAGKYEFSEQKDFVYTGISDLSVSKTTSNDGLTRVYDASGRLVYSSPTAHFNLWDVPARGILVVKQGNNVHKVVR